MRSQVTRVPSTLTVAQLSTPLGRRAWVCWPLYARTLKQTIEEYSADAMRFALADAGDTIEDANFVDETANAAILRMTKELVWIEEMLSETTKGNLRTTAEEHPFADRVFANAINTAIEAAREHFENMMFREALKSGYYDLQSARDAYRLMCGGDAGMRADLAARYVDVSTLLLAPFCPHTCEHVWSTLLGRPGTVTKAGFPVGDAPDKVLTAASKYLDEMVSTIRKGIAKAGTTRGTARQALGFGVKGFRL